jgi:hypothetical protein
VDVMTDMRKILGIGVQWILVLPSRSTVGEHLNCSSSAIRHFGAEFVRSLTVSFVDIVKLGDNFPTRDKYTTDAPDN